jgi:hypothetical protein
MPSRHRSAWRRRQIGQARRRTAVTIAIPVALVVVVGAAVAVGHVLTTRVNDSALAICASSAAYVEPGATDTTTAPAAGTDTTTAPAAGTGTTTAPAAGTDTATAPAAGTDTATAPATGTDTATGTSTATAPATGTSTTTAPAAGTDPATGTSTATAPATGTAAATAAATGTGTATSASSASATACPSGTATASAAAAAANVSCDIIVPANPLSARGLATPYQLTGADGMSPDQSGCTMTNSANLGAFVQATILNTQTGQLYVYDPLVITQGTTPAVNPVVPRLPRHYIATIDFGFNGTNLTQVGATRRALQQGDCVNGQAGSIFGQVSFCNGINFFNEAFQLERQGKLRVPSEGTSGKIVASGGSLGTGQDCPVIRNFDMVDQDPSDNVTTGYLLNPATGQTAQDTTSNEGNIPGSTVLHNGSDNTLLDLFMDPVLGCTPFQAPDLANNGQPTSSQALDELLAAKNEPAIPALVPENDEMTLDGNGQFDAAKTDLYRSEVGQPPVNWANDRFDSPAMYCQNMINIQVPFLEANQTLLATGQSPVPTVGDNLFTFLANRLSMSFTNLNCQNFGMANPVTVTLDGTGAAVAAAFNGAQQGASNTSSTTMPSQGQRQGRQHHRWMNPSGM